MRHVRLLAVVAAVLAVTTSGCLVPVIALPLAAPESGPACGTSDRPETGIQGDVPRVDQLSGRAFQGYNCGLALVGHHDLGRRGGNANMAWSGDCAYVAGVNGVAVVDVSDPTAPQLTTTLHGPGSNFTLETIAAGTTGDRAVLVAGRYGNSGEQAPGVPSPMDIYDVTDCAHPVLRSTYTFPKNIHNLTVSADATHVWTTMPIQTVDITDLAHPTDHHDLDAELTKLESPLAPNQNSHEAWPSPDGTRLYIGSQIAGDETFRILDISAWPETPLTREDILAEFLSPGHSIRPMRVRGRSYVVNSDESIVDPTAKGCLPDALTPFGGVSRPRFTDITDERHPVEVGQFRLAIGEPANCPAQLQSGVNPSVHYQDVDSFTNTRFALVSAWNSGLRIVDVRDPAHPQEAAYFNPGQFEFPGESLNLDKAWGHVRWVPETGQIWMATETGGFWVLQLENGPRRVLGLAPLRDDLAAHGSIPRPAATQGPFGSLLADAQASLTAAYCTLSVVPGTPG